MNNKEIEQAEMKSLEGLKKFAKDNGYEMPDISEYKFVALGYLDISEPYEKGEVPKNFLIKLRLLWNEGLVLGSLGHHDCSFCIDEGNYEIRETSSCEKTLIDYENKVKYKFPEMIFHYIEFHNFKPSDEFIEFVMNKI